MQRRYAHGIFAPTWDLASDVEGLSNHPDASHHFSKDKPFELHYEEAAGACIWLHPDPRKIRTALHTLFLLGEGAPSTYGTVFLPLRSQARWFREFIGGARPKLRTPDRRLLRTPAGMLLPPIPIRDNGAVDYKACKVSTKK